MNILKKLPGRKDEATAVKHNKSKKAPPLSFSKMKSLEKNVYCLLNY